MSAVSLSSRLRERVTVEAEQSEDNGRGGRRVTGWAPIVADVPAEVIALRGDEALTNGVVRGSQLWKVTIRNRPDVLPTYRLRWGAIVMAIRVAAPNVTRDELIMTCESGSGI